MERTMLLYFRLDNQCARILFRIVPGLAVDMLLDTSFINRFTGEILPETHKVVPCQFNPIATATNTQCLKFKHQSYLFFLKANSDVTTHKTASTTNAARRAWQIMLDRYSEYRILITTTAIGTTAVEPRIFQKLVSCHAKDISNVRHA